MLLVDHTTAISEMPTERALGVWTQTAASHMTNLGGLTSAIVLLIILLDHFSKAQYSLSPEIWTISVDKARGEGTASQRCSFFYGGYSAFSYFSFYFRYNFVISVTETGGDRTAKEQSLSVFEVKLV